ncbi:hypothetical protein GUITHDRAFT_153321, partial [Guillardia theta CCMP2712]
MHSKIALALALLGISRFEVAAGSSLKMTITTPKTSQGPAQVGMVLLPASYCHRLRGGGDEGVENADLEKRWTNDKQQSMKERIQQYESLLNADTDAIQEMKDEMEAMREYMKTKLEIAASETKELKK